MRHLILIPTYNEHENIVTLLDALCALPDVDICVIDDASPDGTAQDVMMHPQFHQCLFLLLREGKQGIGTAYRDGMAWGIDREYTTIAQMDADFSHLPEDVPRLQQAILEGADLCIGSRKIAGGAIKGWNRWRRFCSAGAMTASRWCLGLKTKDVTSGFRVWRTAFLKTLPISRVKSSGYAFQEEMVFLTEMAGGVVKEIPVVFRDRTRGVSKLGGEEIREFFTTLFFLTLRRRQRLLRYGFVGLVGAVIDLGAFLVLYHGFHIQLIPANIFATTLAIIQNFVWHHFFTFRDHGRMPVVAFSVFLIVSLVGMVLNTTVVFVGVMVGLWPVMAKVIAIALVTLWNYGVNARVTFRV